MQFTDITPTYSDERNRAVRKGLLFQGFQRMTIPAGQTMYIAMRTKAKTIKVYPSVLGSSADKITFDYLEGGTVTGGTAIPKINQNRQSANVSEVDFLLSPTVTVEGARIADVYLPGTVGAGQTRSGESGGGGDNQWILKPNTTYVYKFINGSTAANIVQLNEIWIEGDI